MGKRREVINARFSASCVITESSDPARELYNRSVFGVITKDACVELTYFEAYYLLQKGKLRVVDGRKKEIDSELFLKKVARKDKEFETKYKVYSDLRTRGYITKTALKFGADFRVYDKGIKPGEDHAKWIVFPIHESKVLTWHDYASKNRVAHSTKKRLLLGIVDGEGDVSYWESKWVRP